VNTTATLTSCTLSNDSALNGGGGLCTDGTTVSVTFSGCTLSNDTAAAGGGVCNTLGTVVLTKCTLANDSVGVTSGGGGLLNQGTATVKACTFSNDTADHNLIGDGGGSTIVTDQGGNLIGGNGNPVIDPRLGPLQNNGGPTETLALLADSPAVGHANNARAPATDQRGVTRIDETGETTDIGAFEL
jgi:hypothetical protein